MSTVSKSVEQCQQCQQCQQLQRGATSISDGIFFLVVHWRSPGCLLSPVYHLLSFCLFVSLFFCDPVLVFLFDCLPVISSLCFLSWFTLVHHSSLEIVQMPSEACKVCSVLQVGMEGWEGMVILGHMSSKSTFGANN